jgi:hypothetical protein
MFGSFGLAEILILLVVFIPYTLLCVAVGVFARRRGRNRGGWSACAFFLSPVVAFAMLLALGHPAPQS